jgi:ribosomal protein L4
VDDLNAYDVLRQQMLIFDEAALRKLEERYGDG